MKKIFFVFLFIALSLYPLVSNAAEQASEEDETIEVTADGVGTIKDDVANARRAAIDDGLRLAVEQAKGVFVNAETEAESYAVIRDEIVTKCTAFAGMIEVLISGQFCETAVLFKVFIKGKGLV